MTTVFHDPKLDGAPAAHAFVIGVGDYPFLRGGEHETNRTWGLGQLTSAPASALAFVRWLEEDFALPAVGGRPARPLGSIELLLSRRGGATHAGKPVDRASKDHARDAFRAWLARADLHEDNLAIVYFCGHGIEDDVHALLLDGFSSEADDIGEHVIDIEGFVENMYRCKARQQLFLIDACRRTPEQLQIDRGIRFLSPVWDKPDIPREVAFIRSTAEFEPAAGLTKDAPTRFTAALLRALRGAACEPVDGGWHVQMDRFVTHINDLLFHEAETLGVREQRASLDELSRNFTLHVPRQPLVPVFVHCVDTGGAMPFAVTRGGQPVDRQASKLGDAWEVELAIDEYELVHQGTTQRVWAKPTLAKVKL